MSTFEQAIPTVLRHEGGYAINPNDPGGETKFGISKRTYPLLDIRNLTTATAAEIYRRDWWDRYGYGRIVEQMIATKILDMAVNLGATKAHKIAQEAAGCIVDGCLGPESIRALNSQSRMILLCKMENLQAEYYRKLASNPRLAVFLNGWLKRAYDRS